MQQGGSQYRRLVSAFQRVFGATIFFGTDTQREKAMVMHRGRFNFMREARIWYSRNPEQEMLPGGFENEVVLSDEFYREVLDHPIPADLEAAKALSCSPAAITRRFATGIQRIEALRESDPDIDTLITDLKHELCISGDLPVAKPDSKPHRSLRLSHGDLQTLADLIAERVYARIEKRVISGENGLADPVRIEH